MVEATEEVGSAAVEMAAVEKAGAAAGAKAAARAAVAGSVVVVARAARAVDEPVDSRSPRRSDWSSRPV